MIHDRRHVPQRHRPALAARRVNDRRRQIGHLGHETSHVVAVRVVALPLQRRVEHPVVRRGVGSGSRRPLPAVGVAGQISVDEMRHEVTRAPLPRQMQILHQEAGHDHAHAIVHPARLLQFAHARVHDRISGLAPTPRREPFLGHRTLVVHHGVHLAIQVAPPRIRETVQHVAVELAPGDLASVHVVRPRSLQVRQQLTRMDDAPTQRDRHPAGARHPGVVATLVVTVETIRAAITKLGPLCVHTPLVEGGKIEVHLGSRRATFARNSRRADPIRVARCVQGPIPAVDQPTLRERREHRIRGAVVLDDGARVHRVRRAHESQRNTRRLQPIAHGVVATRTVRCEVAGGVHRRRPHLGHQRGNHVERVTVSVHQRPTHGIIQRVQRVAHVGTARRSRS